MARTRVLSPQLELSFRPYGGARLGAGRPRVSSAPPHAPRPRVTRHTPVLVTMRARVRDLRRQLVFDRISRSMCALQLPEASRISRDVFRITHFSIQDDHVHLVVEAHDPRALARGVQGLAIRVARAVNAIHRRRGKVWDQRYHARVLKNPAEVRSALVYVLHNRKKHAPLRGALDDKASCVWFEGWNDLEHARRDGDSWARAGPCPVAAPTSWLLRVGWRRHGLLSVHEAPRPQRAAPGQRRALRARAR